MFPCTDNEKNASTALLSMSSLNSQQVDDVVLAVRLQLVVRCPEQELMIARDDIVEAATTIYMLNR
jgi:hypothetical protein